MSHQIKTPAGRRDSRRGRMVTGGLVVLAATAAALAACNDTTASHADRTAYGPAVALGQGTARSYVVLHDGTPTEVGFALSETSFDGLPAGTAGGDPHAMMHEYLLTLPAEA